MPRSRFILPLINSTTRSPSTSTTTNTSSTVIPPPTTHTRSASPDPTSTSLTTLVCPTCSRELEQDMPTTLSLMNGNTHGQELHQQQPRQRIKRAGRMLGSLRGASVSHSIANPVQQTNPGNDHGTAKCSCRAISSGGHNNNSSTGKAGGGLKQQQQHHHHRKASHSISSKHIADHLALVDDDDFIGVHCDADGLRSPELSPVRDTDGEDGRGYIVNPSSQFQPREITLAEFVTTLKKKPRKGKAGDFELVPHMRSVIALDDAALSDGTPEPSDETWEHIDGLDDDDEKSPERISYAKVAAAAASTD